MYASEWIQQKIFYLRQYWTDFWNSKPLRKPRLCTLSLSNFFCCAENSKRAIGQLDAKRSPTSSNDMLRAVIGRELSRVLNAALWLVTERISLLDYSFAESAASLFLRVFHLNAVAANAPLWQIFLHCASSSFCYILFYTSKTVAKEPFISFW